MDVCYASNEAYVPYLGVSMFSLIANNLSEGPLHVHVIANGISQEGCRRLQENAALACRAAGREHASGFQLSFYQLSGLSRRLGGTIDTGSYDISMLGRFFIGELLPETVERVLYLDCDTLVEKSLWPVFQRKAQEAGIEEPEGPALWGVMEPTIYPSILRQLGILEKTGFYINSGVLMVDLVKWRKHQAGERLLRFYRENGERLFCGDQDAINHVMAESIGPLPVEYNFFTNYRYFRYETLVKLCPAYVHCAGSREAFEAAKRQPAVIHFMGAERPWIRGNRNPYRKRFQKWLDLSAFAGMPLTEGREAAMQAYHLMNLATLWLPPVRKAVSRMFERKKVIPRLRPLSKQEI